MDWNELSIYEKANLMKLYVANGITDLNTIKEHYNSFQDGGDTKKPRGYRVSSAIMNLAHRAVDKNAANTIDTPNNGAPQSTFLMNRKNQQKVFEDEGYTKVDNNDYGPVTNAVNTSRHKDVPIYQKYPDVNVDRNNLQKIGTFMDYAINNANTETSVYNGPVESYLTDPANFPVDVYIDRKTGKVYNQGWDYNDYNNIRSTTGVSKLKNVAGNILDRIGNPTVVTTGLQENTIKSTEADRYLQSKNPMLSYQKNEDTGEYEIMMKPITVTAKRTNPVKPKTELRPASELNEEEFWDMMEANSRQNGGSLGKVTPYGQWQYPGKVTTIPSNNITMKGVDYPVIGVSNTGDTKVMFPNMDYLFDGQYVTEYPISYQKGGQLKRVRRNDSPTQTASEKLEDKTAQHIQRFNADKINHSYDIPYIPEKEIVVPGVGRISTNALDSIAKYSVMAGIPLKEGLGLAAQETAFGANPYYNYGSNSEANRALGNSSYFRNYGVIPVNYLVRDWHYFDLTDEQRATTTPLLDAFQYWKAGKYNRGDKNHTSDVRVKGKQVINSAPVQEWMKTSPYVKKKTTKNTK